MRSIFVYVQKFSSVQLHLKQDSRFVVVLCHVLQFNTAGDLKLTFVYCACISIAKLLCLVLSIHMPFGTLTSITTKELHLGPE